MNQNSAAMIVAKDVGKVVLGPEGRLDILNGISFRLARSASLAIVGASGSGKTTLLGLLAGLDSPSSGEILLGGVSLNSLDEDQRAALRRRLVGFVFQSFHLLPALSAQENVMLPLELDGRADARAEAHAALAAVGLSARTRHYPYQLSGGEQQRVALARAFVHKPQLLFADEPTGNLDARTGHAVSELLFDLNQANATTLVLVTHDLKLAERCSNRLYLESGRARDVAA
jgi:putative ABC transport system ATP-binding protein